jgi:pyruvate dehydrogenase E2 component (dihydrolipoamide acetyltransferase)
MPLDVVMPKLGLTMTEGLLVEWKKNEGDPVKKGEVLFVLETEKVTYEVESPEDGVLGRIVIHANETVPVGAVVAYLLLPGESADDLDVAAKPAVGPVAKDTPPPESAAEGEPAERLVRLADDSRVKASPLARKIARSHNVDLRSLQGTGPGGRIIREDVEKALEEVKTEAPKMAAPSREPAAERLAPFTGMRRAIARKMMASKVETAQTYMSNTVDASNIVASRKAILPRIQEMADVRVTITDIMMKITGAALSQHPVINTRWTDKGVLYLADVHMGMAMALDEGLIVPVIKDINRKGLAQIAKDRVELIRKGKANQFLPDDISGSTFTLSAMGMFGIEHFTANINVPENAILAVGAIIDKPVVVDGQITIRPMMNVTLSYDHRAIDGAEAGKFMRTLTAFIENPVLITA